MPREEDENGVEIENEEEDDEDEGDVEMIELDPIFTAELDLTMRLPPHRRCASHTLSRVAVHDVEKEFAKEGVAKNLHDSVMTKCRALWNFQSRSTLCHDKVQESLGVLFVIPNETRWNSKYDALSHMQRMMKEKTQELRELMTDRKKEHFTANEITWLKEYLLVSHSQKQVS